MPDTVVKSVSDLLNEEKWTRATLNSYTIANFKELDEIIAQVRAASLDSEIRDLSRGAPQAHQEQHHRPVPRGHHQPPQAAGRRLAPGHASSTSSRTTTSGPSSSTSASASWSSARTSTPCAPWPTATRTRTSRPKKLEIWERLIRVDYEEADIVRRLAEKQGAGRRRSSGDRLLQKGAAPLHQQEDVRQRARTSGTSSSSSARATSTSTSRVEEKIAKVLSGERAATLLATLYPLLHGSARTGTRRSGILKRPALLRRQEPRRAQPDHRVLPGQVQQTTASSRTTSPLEPHPVAGATSTTPSPTSRSTSLSTRATSSITGPGESAASSGHQGRRLHHRLRGQARPQDVAQDGRRRPQHPSAGAHLGAQGHLEKGRSSRRGSRTIPPGPSRS